MSLIYLDTNLWNRLNAQRVDAERFLYGLRSRDANLALSGQTVYELAKTFLRTPQRAQELFKYIKRFVDAGVPAAHDNMEMLFQEVKAKNTGATSLLAFYGPLEYSALKAEVDKLAQGTFDDHAELFVKARKHFAAVSRLDQQTHLDNKQNVRAQLKAISKSQLKGWLGNEVRSNNGAALLARHLLRLNDELPVGLAIQNALELLAIPPSRISKGLVRADLYSNWRCANRGSNSKDLIDDMYHVLNASYCDVYATAELGQVDYAELLLSQWTRVAIYDERSPIDKWLMEQA